jgi:hypothetical protein
METAVNATQIQTGGERKSMGRWINGWLGSKAKAAHGRARTRATLSVDRLEGRVVLSSFTTSALGSSPIQNSDWWLNLPVSLKPATQVTTSTQGFQPGSADYNWWQKLPVLSKPATPVTTTTQGLQPGSADYDWWLKLPVPLKPAAPVTTTASQPSYVFGGVNEEIAITDTPAELVSDYQSLQSHLDGMKGNADPFTGGF